MISDEIDLSGVRLLDSKKFFVKTDFGISNQDIISKYGDYDILIIRSIRKIDKDFLKKTAFSVIATCSKGTDHIDLRSANRRGIKILNSESGNTLSAAEHTMALILAIYKNLIYSDKLVRSGKFKNYDFTRNELYKKKIGIIGFGKVGSKVGKFSRAFGMEVIANDIDERVKEKNRSFEFRDLKYIIKNCDIISLHIPLNEKNKNFFSEKKMKMVNKNSVLINTSRGEVIDQSVLLRMLKDNKIRFAGLDVYRNEPNVDKGLTGLSNVILTNHIAGKTIESKKRIAEDIFLQVKKLHSK